LTPLLAMANEKIPDPAQGWEDHFRLWLIISIVIYLVVTIPLIYFVFKYRRKKPDENGAYIEGNTALEILWIVIPIIITILLGVQSWALFEDYRTVPKGAFEAKSVAFMYGFEMISPEGISTMNELRVPVGPVKVNLTSKDVIHDFAIPKFRVREDMLPGRNTYLWFNAKETGTYPVYCSFYCGTGHSDMKAKVIVMNKDDYEAWAKSQKSGVAEAATAEPASPGKTLFDKAGCMGCHSITGEVKTGPALNGIVGKKVALEDGSAVTIDEAFIKEKIATPSAKPIKGFPHIMPAGLLNTSESDAVIEYLKTLK
jgi:cytochrome c oxidase subunit 2